MDSALYRIIDYPHAPVFDKAPQEVLALRLRHPSGLSWSVDRGVLTVKVGADTWSYQLAEMTIAQLADALLTDGFDVPYENPALGSRAAFTLIRGAKNQDETNGDHLVAYTSLLWALYDAYGAELDHADYEVREALRQMVMTQAEGEWLDVWANLYGIPRLGGESDAALQVRLPDEAFALRVNGIAIEERIKRATGKDVQIFEPWKLIFTLDQSTLSGPDRFEDDTYYNYHVIQPVSKSPIDFTDVIKVVDRNRAAGVVQYPPQVVLPTSHVSAEGSAVLAFCRREERGQVEKYRDSVYLDYMAIEDVSIVNHSSRQIREIRRFSQLVAYPPGYDIVVDGDHMRDYRSYSSGSEYIGRYWVGSWAGGWADTTVVQARHSRSS